MRINLETDMEFIFYIKYFKTCGYRRMHSELQDLGWRISELKTREKMKELGLYCDIRRIKRATNHTDKKSERKELKNILDRNFETNKPDEKYCTDTTEIETVEEGVVNCSVILDLFNLEPFGLAIGKSCNTELTTKSVLKLSEKRKLKGSILHSDQGVTYTSSKYGDLLNKLEIQQSLSRKGCPYDNCLMENFWGTLKVEFLYKLHRKPQNITELTEMVENYIDFYVNVRKNSRLGNLTPAQYYNKYKDEK